MKYYHIYKMQGSKGPWYEIPLFLSKQKNNYRWRFNLNHYSSKPGWHLTVDDWSELDDNNIVDMEELNPLFYRSIFETIFYENFIE